MNPEGALLLEPFNYAELIELARKNEFPGFAEAGVSKGVPRQKLIKMLLTFEPIPDMDVLRSARAEVERFVKRRIDNIKDQFAYPQCPECIYGLEYDGKPMRCTDLAVADCFLANKKSIEVERGTFARDGPEPKEEMDAMISDAVSAPTTVMGIRERQEQLRYLTGTDGKPVLTETGQKIVRGGFPLRHYAVDPEGPVRAEPHVVLFWSSKQLIDGILAAEKAAGLVVSAAEKKKSQPKEEEGMARKISLKGPMRPTAVSAEAPAEGPSRSRTTTKAPPKKTEAPKATKEAAPPTVGSAIDYEAIASKVLALLGPEIDKRMDERLTEHFNDLKSFFDLKHMETMLQIHHTKLRQDVLHDVFMQTTTGSDENNLLGRDDGDMTLDDYMGGTDTMMQDLAKKLGFTLEEPPEPAEGN